MSENERKIKVLLIEDDIVDQMAFKRLVKTQNLPYDYRISSCVKEALEVLDSDTFDIILADFNLGDGTAFDIFEKKLATPYIFVTGSGDEEIAVKALKKGARDYLIKDNERSYLQLLPVIVEQTIRHHRMETAQAEAEQRIKMLFHAIEQSSASIVITDIDGNIEYVNPKFEEVTGYSSQEVMGKNPRILKTEYHGKETYEELWETVLAGKNWTGEFLNRKKNGLNYWESAKISPVFDQAGKIKNIIGIKEDITEKKKVKQALEFRVKMVNLINQISTNFINLTTARIDDAVNESLGKISNFINTDFSLGYLLDEDGTKFINKYKWKMPDLDIHQTAPEKIECSSLNWFIQKLNDQDMLFVPSVNMLPPQAEGEKELMISLSVRSVVFLPMIFENKMHGFICFCSIQYEKYWDEDSLKLLKILVEIIVNALQRKKTAEEIENLYHALKQDVELAGSVQTYLVPQWLRYDNEIVFSSIYNPSSSIGGDLFDIVKIDESRYVVYIGDISGHGVKAALMMTAVKSIINMLIENEKYNLLPHYILGRLNKILCRSLFQNDYMTISMGLIDLQKNELRFMNAGHPAPIEFDRKELSVSVFSERGAIPIGWDEDFVYKSEDEILMPFSADKIYVIYTDGIFECENPQKNQLGLKGFQEIIQQEITNSNPIMLPYKFKQKLLDKGYDIQSDDFTMLTFHRPKTAANLRYSKLFLVNSLKQNTGQIANECYLAMINFIDNPKLATEVELVINEFLNNIIEHGMQTKKDTIIALQMEIGEKIRLLFMDNGLEWELPAPKEDNIAKPEKFRGMGMQIIYKIISHIEKNRFCNINETIIEVDLK